MSAAEKLSPESRIREALRLSVLATTNLRRALGLDPEKTTTRQPPDRPAPTLRDRLVLSEQLLFEAQAEVQAALSEVRS